MVSHRANDLNTMEMVDKCVEHELVRVSPTWSPEPTSERRDCQLHLTLGEGADTVKSYGVRMGDVRSRGRERSGLEAL